MKTRTDGREGQALVEVMVALTVLTVGFLSVVALLSQSIAANRIVSTEYVATYLAVEGNEMVKNIIDSNIANGRSWDTGLAAGTYQANIGTGDLTSVSVASVPSLMYCPAYGQYVTSCTGSSGSTFKRFLTISYPGGAGTDELKVVTHVTSTASAGPFGLDVETHYYNWVK